MACACASSSYNSFAVFWPDLFAISFTYDAEHDRHNLLVATAYHLI